MGDTTSEAALVRENVLRGLSGSARLDLAVDASEMARSLALARLRRANPALPERELIVILVRERHGLELLPQLPR